VVLVLLALVGAAGCGEPPWKQAGVQSSPTATATPSVSRTPTPTPTPTPTKSITVQRNDLIKGSVKRHLTAGGMLMTINYYSTLSMAQWTPAVTKPLTLSASAKFADGSKQDIFMRKVVMRVDVAGPEGALSGPKPLTDVAGLNPGYLIKAPNAYGGIFSIPALPDKATSMTLNITYELLAPSAPKSTIYSKSSANDTLVIALAS
jgi:hypothetical protein